MEQKANIQKDKGNVEFKNKNYREAIKFYTYAIAIFKSHVYYSNRSSCYLRVHEYHKAIEDGLAAIKLKPDFIKAYYKTGIAYKHTG